MHASNNYVEPVITDMDKLVIIVCITPQKYMYEILCKSLDINALSDLRRKWIDVSELYIDEIELSKQVSISSKLI